MEKFLFDWKEYTLENGLKIVTVKKDTKLSSVHIGINTGPIYEEYDEKGLSHFIEHMIFKGTKIRSNEEIDQDLEDTAGSYNAYTTYTATAFSITALYNELEKSLEILSDMVKNSVFSLEEIEKERGVILAEFKNSYDDVEHYSFNKVNYFGFKNSHLKYDILGEEALIKSFNREKIVSFYNKFYRPNNSVISIVSPLEHDEIINKIQMYFNDWENKDLEKRPIIVEKNQGIEVMSSKSEIEQNTIVYLYTFYNLNREEELALEILNHKLGESANSILFRALREEKGISYDIYSEIDSTDFIKTMNIYCAASGDDIFEAKRTIDRCIEKIVNREIIIDEKNINLMKKVMKTGIASILEDSEGLCNYVLHQKLMNRKVDGFTNDLEQLNHIKTEDVYKVAKKVLVDPTIHILINKK